VSDADAAAGQTFDLAALLTREHHDIDGGIERYLENQRSANATDATPLLDAMAALRRHIYLEEQFVFPALASGALMIPIQVMLREHGAIWRAMDGLAERLTSDADPARLKGDCLELLGLLESHNAKEEPVIYPRAQPALDPEEQRELEEFMASGRMPDGWVCRTAAQ
jgi:hemerythrin-like domain-containing protein